MKRYKLAIDIGGTFVDVVLFDFAERALRAFKLPTTPEDPASGVIEGIRRLDESAAGIFEFVHGTTLGLNAILERKGAPVGIIATEGFHDIFAIGRGSLEFADMYRFDYEQPPSLVRRRDTRGVGGRIDYLGREVAPLDEAGVLEAARQLIDENGCGAIAISFLHSYANEVHERTAVKLIRAAHPGIEVSAGALLANEYREYERTSTAVLDAYIKPVLKNYLGRVTSGIEAAGFAGGKYVMNSSGGALTFSLAEAEPISTILSGPAGGVSGALHVAGTTGRRNVLSLDVGGTSLDACLIVDFQPVDVFEARIDGFPILQPIFDLRTLGAGGGSIARVDNRLLRVGPESAGAVPGPACYGRGGAAATVTDAALVLGYIDAGNFMGGEMAVAHDLAAEALKKDIGDVLGIPIEEAARSILDVLISRTSSSIKEMMLERGLDPRDFSLLAFGGCGPLLGPMLLDELEMSELVTPPLPSVFSAWGMMASDLSFSDTASVLERVSDAAMERVDEIGTELRTRAVAELREKTGEKAEPEVTLSVRLRFIGQEHTLSVPYLSGDSAEALFGRFSHAHLKRFGHTFENDAEIVSMMVKLVLVTQKPDIEADAGLSLRAPDGLPHRMFDPAVGSYVDCIRVGRGDLAKGSVCNGPLLMVDEGSSLAVQKGQKLQVEPSGMISVTRVQGG